MSPPTIWRCSLLLARAAAVAERAARCGRVLAEASNRSRLELRRCSLGGDVGGGEKGGEKVSSGGGGDVRGDGRGGGSGGGGVLVRHGGTSAFVRGCIVAFARYACVDAREGARLELASSTLALGRTSGLFASAGAGVCLGSGVRVLGVRLAAVEAGSGAQVVCSCRAAAAPFLATAPVTSALDEGGGAPTAALGAPGALEPTPRRGGAASEEATDGAVVGCGARLLVSDEAVFAVQAQGGEVISAITVRGEV